MTDQHNNIFKQWLKPFAISTLSVSMLIACGVNANLTSEHIERTNITDKWVSRTDSLSSDKTPPDPVKGSYGLNKKTGKFTHPLATRDTHDSIRFDGELDYWDTQQYIKNMKIEAYYPITVEPFHTWQNIVDFDGKRYLYQYVRRDLKIFDITNPKDVKLLLTRGHTWGKNGADEVDQNPYPRGEMFGAASIQWNKKLQKNIMVQAYEIRRFGLLKNKLCNRADILYV